MYSSALFSGPTSVSATHTDSIWLPRMGQNGRSWCQSVASTVLGSFTNLVLLALLAFFPAITLWLPALLKA